MERDSLIDSRAAPRDSLIDSRAAPRDSLSGSRAAPRDSLIDSRAAPRDSLSGSRAAPREKYVPPKAHRCDPEWLEALDERHRQLHLLAQEKLGSSYFADRTHGISKVIKTLKESTNKK